MLGDLNNVLGIIASLIAILSPLLGVIFNKKDSDFQSGGTNVTNINNYNYYGNKNTSNQKRRNETLDYIIKKIIKNHKELISYSEIMLLLACVFSLINLIITVLNNDNSFIITRYVNNILSIGGYGLTSYIVAFLIPFLGFFFSSYFLLAYYYDLKLRNDLDIFNYLEHRPSLKEIQRILVKEHKFSSLSMYPVQTMARLIVNSDIKAKNKRRTKMPHDSLKLFWTHLYVVLAFLSLGAIHLAFDMAYSPIILNNH